MAEQKDLDERHITRDGGTIRVETWVDPRSGAVVRYNLAYVNPAVHTRDNGRVLGFDNSHQYPGFASAHHAHWMGRLRAVPDLDDFEDILERFQRALARLKRCLGKEY